MSLSLIALFAGAVGALLSVARSRWCFVVWQFPNVYWAIYNWHNGERLQACVFVVMFWSCLAGWLAWGWAEGERRAEIWNIQMVLAKDYKKNLEILYDRIADLEKDKALMNSDRILRNRGDES